MTPALTVPQVREALGQTLHRLLECTCPDVIGRTMTRRLKRNEEARFYHWKQRNRLPPQRSEQ